MNGLNRLIHIPKMVIEIICCEVMAFFEIWGFLDSGSLCVLQKCDKHTRNADSFWKKYVSNSQNIKNETEGELCVLLAGTSKFGIWDFGKFGNL